MAKIYKIFLSVALLLVVIIPGVFGQDMHFTQFSNVPLYYNPAFTGIYTGARVRLTSLVQGPTPATGFNAYHVSADVGDRNLPGSGGFGVMLNTDNEGLSFIKNFNLGVSFAARVPFNRNMIGQVGIRASWIQKSISWDKFNSSDRLSEKYGHVYDSGFIRSGRNVLNIPDVGIGGVVQFVNNKGCLSGTVGVAIDHLFEPDESFAETAKSPIARKYTGHADLVFSVRCASGFNAREDDPLKVNPGIMVQHQGNVNEFQAGLNLTNYGIYFGAWYHGVYGPVNSNSAALSGGYRYVMSGSTSIKLTYTYDMQIAGTHKCGGTHEISFVLEFVNLHIFRGSGDSYRGLSQAKQAASQLAYAGF